MIYGIISTILFIIILPFWLVAGIFNPKLINGFKEKCGFYGKKLLQYKNNKKSSKTILFYGVSVGEVLAMENLIKKTRESFKDENIIILTGTKTGQDMANKKLGNTADFISYFPFDFPFCVKNMLKKLNPDTILVMETELWPNFAYITCKKQIPFYIINARISDRTYKSYKKLSFIFAPILKKYTEIFPQSNQDMKKFVSIGSNLETTRIMGNLKFDIKKPDTSELKFEKTANDKIFLAGSTHTGEDEIIISTFMNIKKEISELKLIIAPRHPERNDNVFKLMEKTGYKVGKRSLNNDLSDNDIILLDTMGELGKFYSICDIAFLGGSFNKTGGHNPLEATIFSKPVLSGPDIHNFKDIYAILKYENAGKIVNTEEELTKELKNLLQNETAYKDMTKACEKVFEDNSGALKFVIGILKKV